MLYYLVYPFIYLVSFIPLPVLYFISDAFAFVLYHIARYRREVVRDNLLKSFPDKSIKEIMFIEKKFYRFFTQWVIETLKLSSISLQELKKRCRFTDNFKKIFHRYYEEKRNIFVLMGHIGNWEWAGAAFNLYFQQKLFVLYHPLSNKTFDKIMLKIRSRTGTQLLPMHTATKYILANNSNANVYAFIADQCPSPQNAFWMKFLNQDTAVYYVPEKICTKINAVPLIVTIQPTLHKRGYYIIDAQEIVPNKNTDEKYPIMRQFMLTLEKAITKHPEYWLWSHKRWKLKK